MTMHSATIKIAFDDEKAKIILECETCGVHEELCVPVNHLATMANACATAAEHAGVAGVVTPVATFATETASEAECDAVLELLKGRIGPMH